jgi:hypothetical protein
LLEEQFPHASKSKGSFAEAVVASLGAHPDVIGAGEVVARMETEDLGEIAFVKYQLASSGCVRVRATLCVRVCACVCGGMCVVCVCVCVCGWCACVCVCVLCVCCVCACVRAAARVRVCVCVCTHTHTCARTPMGRCACMITDRLVPVHSLSTHTGDARAL